MEVDEVLRERLKVSTESEERLVWLQPEAHVEYRDDPEEADEVG